MTLPARLALGVALVAILLSPARAAQGPKIFSTPEDAATALVEACERHDTAALAAILGPDAGDLINSGDPVQDKARLDRFVRRAKEALRVEPDPFGAGRLVIIVGEGPLAGAAADREGVGRVPVRRRRGEGRDPGPPGRPERAQRHRRAARFRGGGAGVRLHRLEQERHPRLRAADPERSRTTQRPLLGGQGWGAAESAGPDRRPGHRRGVRAAEARRAGHVPRLRVSRPQGPGPPRDRRGARLRRFAGS